MNFKIGEHKSWALNTKLSKLRELIVKASDVYYNTEDTIISDNVFDELLEIYNFRADEPLKLIGAQSTSIDKVKLPCHMGSMNKTYSIKEFVKWVNKNSIISVDNQSAISLPISYVITPKIDGSSCLLTIKVDGKINIYSRGNGTEGKSLNHLEPFILNSKIKELIIRFLKCNRLKQFMCRGELIVNKSNFTKVSKEFKSSRSLVNGISNKKKSLSSDTCNLLELLIFEVIEPKLKPSDQFTLLQKLNLNYVTPVSMTTNQILDKCDPNNINDCFLIQYLNKLKSTYDYDIDGLIITKDELYSVPDSGNPEYSIAFKNNGDGELTKVTKIDWNVSKHGVLIPTIVFETIILGSSKVSKCTGFNGMFIFNNSIGKGAIIRVVLGGEVIPYISQIVEQSIKPDMPQQGYKWSDNKVHCLQIDSNEEFDIKKVVNFIKVLNIDFLAIGMIRHLFKNGYNSLKKILLIRYEDLLALDRIEHKMALKIRMAIDDKIKKPIQLSKLMDGSLCFGNGFGLKRCQQIESKYPNFLTQIPNDSQLLELAGWSGKSIEKFKSGIETFRDFLEEHDFLKVIALSNTNSYSEDSDIPYKKVCITGKRDSSITTALVNFGIQISPSVTKDVEALICFDTASGSGKIKAASDKGIPIYSVVEFKHKYKIE